jgi:uncharacterized protein YjbI with pentapeptide repeats
VIPLSPWPVELVGAGDAPSTCGAVLWRSRGEARLTIVVKATFGIVPEGVARPVAPPGLVVRDVHYRDDPRRSVHFASELAPYLAQAEVLLTGHAFAPGGRPVASLTVRLVVQRGATTLFDKATIVAGERDPSGARKPFQNAPLVYELARFDAEENPHGLTPEQGEPRLVSPRSPTRPGGLGPLSRHAAARARLTGGANPDALVGSRVDLPDGVDFGFFQASPTDQRMDFLQGDEELVLVGLHPALPVTRTRLPQVRALARLYRGGAAEQDLELYGDTLSFDTSLQTVTVLFRNNLTVKEAELEELTVYAGISSEGRELAFPESHARKRQNPLSTTARAPDSESLRVPALPFDPRAISQIPPPAPHAPFTLDDEGTSAGSEALPAGFALPFRDAAPPPAPTPYFERGTEAVPSTYVAPRDVARDVVPEPSPPSLRVEATYDDIELEPDSEDPMEKTFGLAPAETAALTRGLPFAPPTESAPSASAPKGPLPGTPWAAAPPDAAAPPLFDPREHTSTQFISAELQARLSGRDLPPPLPPLPGASERGEGAHGLPERKHDNVPIYNVTPFAAVTMAWQLRPPRDSMTVIVKGTFTLVPDGAATAREESEVPMGDVFAGDDPQKSLVYPSDLVIWKPQADVVLLGHAVAPGGSSPAAEVRFQLGEGERRIQRRVVVFGERRWEKSMLVTVPTSPRPFERMPLVAERAFGGPGFDANPVGVGWKGAAGSDGVAFLPNIEDPERLVKGPGDRPSPMLVGPVSMFWKERWSKVGTYDAKWVKTRWPYFPEDFDWHFFQHAPPKQRLPYLVGDEAFEITGMHREHPRLSGTLPGIAPRVFMQRTETTGGAFEEVLLRLDTVTFQVDTLTLTLVWRGVVEVSDDDAPEIGALFVMADPLGAPRTSLDEAKKRFELELLPKEEIEDSGDEGDPAPANEVEPPDPEQEAAEALLAEQEKKTQALLATLPPALAPSAPSESSEPDPAALADSLRKAGVPEEDVANTMEALAPPPGAPPLPDPRAVVIAKAAAREPMDGMELEGADLSELDLSGQSFVGADLRRVSLRKANLSGANLTGALLSEADLREATLEGATLDDADVVRAFLDGVKLSGASLRGATFDGSRAPHAQAAGTTADGATFVGVDLTGARFEDALLDGADFTEARLDGAVFDRAKLADATFYDAQGEGASFEEARMVDARLDGAKLPRCSFKKVHAKGSIWERAFLEEASFIGADLSGASLVRVRGARMKLSGADLTDAVLRRAKLPRAELFKANLMGATLERADLTGADLRGANLHGTETWKAVTEGADLDFALVTKSKLKGGA